MKGLNSPREVAKPKRRCRVRRIGLLLAVVETAHRGLIALVLACALALVAILLVWPTHQPAQAAGKFEGFRAACYASMPAKVADPIRHTHHIHEPSGALIFEDDQDYTDLRNAGSNCDNEDRTEAMHDHSSAWSPQLRWDGVLLDQGRSGKYYNSKGVSDPTITEPFPLGMKMVASEDVGKVKWACGAVQGEREFTEHPPRSCPRRSEGISLLIQFGQCWDGKRTGTDGAHNLAEAVRGKCPASHPHQIPTITWYPYYPIPADVLATIDGRVESSTDDGWVLADDKMHADMQIGFDTTTLVRQCIVQPARFGEDSKRGRRPDYCDATGPHTSPDTPDAPGVLSTTPADGATGVDRDADITVMLFTEKMLGSSINGDTFRLYEGTYTDEDLNPPECQPDQPDCAPPLPFGATVTGSMKKAILNPDGRLAEGTNYTAVLEGTDLFDTFAVKDEAGNEMAADQIWHFQTGAN
jgi:hypothetical protein